MRGAAATAAGALVAMFAALLGASPPPAGAQGLAPGDRRPDLDLPGPETRAMQEDDALNPGMLWVLDGEELWGRPAGPDGRSCADCHGDARESMAGVAARYPAFDAGRQRPVTLEGRVQACREERQGVPASPPESRERLALVAYVAHQSRGTPVTAGSDERLRPFLARGQQLFERRQGQLDLSCADCHDRRWGQRLGGSVIPQAHPTGYPLYRLEWQGLGSLQRRLRNCMAGVRAEPYAFDSPEHVDLEVYLTWRARGLLVETPGVRP
jgi:sulfur-oxidizing protein SoxA